uniref:Uncharacterized protein n=1 Tax=Ditylenchus dipsaci TaxID=166011 RepID=A0A915DC25_9BILA
MFRSKISAFLLAFALMFSLASTAPVSHVDTSSDYEENDDSLAFADDGLQVYGVNSTEHATDDENWLVSDDSEVLDIVEEDGEPAEVVSVEEVVIVVEEPSFPMRTVEVVARRDASVPSLASAIAMQSSVEKLALETKTVVAISTLCDPITSRCNSIKAHRDHGFATLGDALVHFCNHKSCSRENATDACFGLPCHSGRCEC